VEAGRQPVAPVPSTPTPATGKLELPPPLVKFFRHPITWIRIKVELIIEDDSGTPEKGGAGFRKLYYRRVARLGDSDFPADAGEFQLGDRVIIYALRSFDDYYPYIRGMIANCGFRSTAIEYTWRARKKGVSKNRLHHLIDQGLNGLISFTMVPLRLCMLLGLVIAVASIGYSLVNVIVHLLYFRELAPPGIATLIVAVFFFSGLQLFFFGVLGEYIGAIHFQVRKRPLVIERERVNFEQ